MKTLVLDRASTMSFPNAPAAVSVSQDSNGDVRVSMAVNDTRLRSLVGDAFDGLERPFIELNGKRLTLDYLATVGGSGSTPVVDHYELLLKGASLSAAQASLIGLSCSFRDGSEETEVQFPAAGATPGA